MRRLTVLALLAFICLAAPAVAQSPPPLPAAITSLELWQAFQDDPQAAHKRYVNKVVTVSGIVVARDISQYLTPYIALSNKADGQSQVICVLPRTDALALAEFHEGQQVTMAGTGYGFSEKGVVLKRCLQVQ